MVWWGPSSEPILGSCMVFVAKQPLRGLRVFNASAGGLNVAALALCRVPTICLSTCQDVNLSNLSILCLSTKNRAADEWQATKQRNSPFPFYGDTNIGTQERLFTVCPMVKFCRNIRIRIKQKRFRICPSSKACRCKLLELPQRYVIIVKNQNKHSKMAPCVLKFYYAFLCAIFLGW